MTYYDKDGVLRFERINDKKQLDFQLKEFQKAAKKGQVLCLSDLIINAENIYLKNYNKEAEKHE